MRSTSARLLALVTTVAIAAAACVGHDDRAGTATTASPTRALDTSELAESRTPLAPPVAVPGVDAAAYAVFDADTGTMLTGFEADTPRPIASVNKLLTAYVVMRAGDPIHLVTVPEMEIDPTESAIGLHAGEQLPRDVLLRAMLIVSANDAARALAIDVAGTESAFVELMNTAAADLGLTDTHAANPVGLDADGAHSTAHDVGRLAAALMTDETFRTTVARTEARLHDQVFPATNDDFLFGYPGANGIKTGTTSEAGSCLVASATRDGRTLIAVVLGASSPEARTTSAERLLDWAFANRA